jgi:hypothetical protein
LVVVVAAPADKIVAQAVMDYLVDPAAGAVIIQMAALEQLVKGTPVAHFIQVYGLLPEAAAPAKQAKQAEVMLVAVPEVPVFIILYLEQMLRMLAVAVAAHIWTHQEAVERVAQVEAVMEQKMVWAAMQQLILAVAVAAAPEEMVEETADLV